jgi:hypothetical protein
MRDREVKSEIPDVSKKQRVGAGGYRDCSDHVFTVQDPSIRSSECRHNLVARTSQDEVLKWPGSIAS